jgi:hypothetical protein
MRKHSKRTRPDSFPFSELAQEAVLEQAQEHEKELRLSSVDVAQRCHSDSVSAEHVMRASAQLDLGVKKKSAVLVAFGSILVGGALDHVLAIDRTPFLLAQPILSVDYRPSLVFAALNTQELLQAAARCVRHSELLRSAAILESDRRCIQTRCIELEQCLSGVPSFPSKRLESETAGSLLGSQLIDHLRAARILLRFSRSSRCQRACCSLSAGFKTDVHN